MNGVDDELERLRAENADLRQRLEAFLNLEGRHPPHPLTEFTADAVEQFERRCQRLHLTEASYWFSDHVLGATTDKGLIQRIAAALRNAGHIAAGLQRTRAASQNYRVSYDLHLAIDDMQGIYASGMMLVDEDVLHGDWGSAHSRIRTMLGKAEHLEHRPSIDGLSMNLLNEAFGYVALRRSLVLRTSDRPKYWNAVTDHHLYDSLPGMTLDHIIDDILVGARARHRWSLPCDDVLHDMLMLLLELERHRPSDISRYSSSDDFTAYIDPETMNALLLRLTEVAIEVSAERDDPYFLMRFTRCRGTCLLRDRAFEQAGEVLERHLRTRIVLGKATPPWFVRHGLSIESLPWSLPVDDRSDPGFG